MLTIAREEGPLALYKGAIPALMLVSHGAVQFVVYEWLKSEVPKLLHPRQALQALQTQQSSGSSGSGSSGGGGRLDRCESSVPELNSFHFLAMGAAAKVVASIATYPFQVVKTRLQQRRVQRSDGEGGGGGGGGGGAQAASGGNGRGGVGAAAGAAADGGRGGGGGGGRGSGRVKKWTPDKMFHGTRMQYRGVVDCVVKTWTHEGVYGFYKGCLPNAIRVAPGAAVTFFTYETVADVLRK